MNRAHACGSSQRVAIIKLPHAKQAKGPGPGPWAFEGLTLAGPPKIASRVSRYGPSQRRLSWHTPNKPEEGLGPGALGGTQIYRPEWADMAQASEGSQRVATAALAHAK